MLLGLNSCVISEGTERNPDKQNDLLYRQVVENVISSTLEHVRYAAYAEERLTGNTEDAEFIKSLYFPDAAVTVGEQEIKIVFYPGERYTYTYIIVTNGERLADGAIWTLEESYGDDDYQVIDTFTGIKGEERTVLPDNDLLGHFYYYGDAETNIKATYSIDKPGKRMKADVSGVGEVGEEKSYRTSFTIDKDKPLLHIMPNQGSYFASGEVNVLYEDFVENTTHEVSIIIQGDGSHIYQ